MTVKVSICIPTYNQTKYLKKTLDSILIQEYKDYEIIVSDDSTNEEVKELVESYNFGSKLRYYRNIPSLGSPENWNAAIRKSEGQFIKIMHHDDWFSTDKSLAEFMLLAEENPQCDFIFSGSHVMSETKDDWFQSIRSVRVHEIRINPELLFCSNSIGVPSSVLFKNGKDIYFDKNLKWLVDLEFYIRFLYTNKSFAYTLKPLTVTFEPEGRITNTCKDNKNVEVYEYFYVYNSFKKLQKCRLKLANMIQLLAICRRFDINDVESIRSVGYFDKIPFFIWTFLFFNKIHRKLGSLFIRLLMLLRWIFNGR